MKITILVLALTSIILRGCEEDNFDKNAMKITDGIYKGTFTLTTSQAVESGETTIELKAGTFKATGNRNRIPAGGSGSFSLSIADKTITFNDENFWTADFDWSLILSGEFSYSFDGKTLVLTRTVGDGDTTQKYELNKIE